LDTGLCLEPDDGQTAALRTGFERASGDLLGWLNSDDILEPEALATACDVFAAQSDVVLVSGACLFIDADGRITGAMRRRPVPTFDALCQHSSQSGSSPPRSFGQTHIGAAGGLDLGFDLAMDLDLWLRLVKQGATLSCQTAYSPGTESTPGPSRERLAVASAREDLRARRRQGMPWRSQAGVELLRKGYLGPFSGACRTQLAARSAEPCVESSSGPSPELVRGGWLEDEDVAGGEAHLLDCPTAWRATVLRGPAR